MAENILSVQGITKAFSGIKALDDVSFTIEKGTVVGLVGANGAGKSTLLKIIGGVQKSDSGEILLNGQPQRNLTPKKAKDNGIISVYQELNLFSYKSIAENLFLGCEPRNRLHMIDWSTMFAEADKILEQLGLNMKSQTPVEKLSVAHQHMIEIAKAVVEGCDLLLLDEPTSSLSETEIVWLFEQVKRLKEQGTTIVYVSHRLDEIIHLCDSCVVVRDGRLVKILKDEFDKDILIKYMIGHQISIEKQQGYSDQNEVVFSCDQLSGANGRFENISFSIYKGEILGIVGLVGAGRTELLRGIYGIDRLSKGTMQIHGKAVDIHSPDQAIQHGVVMVPEDRKIEGLFMEEPIRFNIAMTTIGQRQTRGFVQVEQEKTATAKIAKAVRLSTENLMRKVKILSGGNQQKVVMAKALLADADILLLDEPTRGVDVGARDEIYTIIRTLVSQGKSILLVSSDWDELMALSDRMVVMAEGHLVGELTEEQYDQEKMLHMASVAIVAKGGEQAKPVRKKWLGGGENNILFFLLAGLIVFGMVASPSFRTWNNVNNLLSQAAALLFMTIGQMIILVSGGIDLSVGSLMAVLGVLGVGTMTKNPNMLFLGIVLMLGIALLVGLLNAVLVVKCKIDSFIATFGVGIILQGVALIYTRKAIGPSPKMFRNLVNGNVLGVSNVFLILVVVIAVFLVLLKYYTVGRNFFAVGENQTAAYWAGLPAIKVKFLAYLVCSGMVMLGTLFMMGRTGAADPTFGPGLTLGCIAAALIGGVAMNGGRGKISGVVCGVAVVTIINNILNLLSIYAWYQEIITGVLLIIIIVSYAKMEEKQKQKKSVER